MPTMTILNNDIEIAEAIPRFREVLHANLDAAYALHCALVCQRMYKWKGQVLKYIDKECPDTWSWPATDSLEMPIQILKRFYPKLWEEVEHCPIGQIIKTLNGALYPI